MTRSDSTNPFIVHRHQLDVYDHARARGLGDDDYRRLVHEADRNLAATAGHGFEVTPLVDLQLDPELDAGTVVAKVETGSVGGSHKARHLFGLLLRLLIDQADGPGHDGPAPPLAIASCGNAALGAALVARSARRRLQVFVPAEADPFILAELQRLGAETVTCTRQAGAADGDPCVVALDHAIEDGSVPFTVQGSRTPAVIDGARTIGLELADQLAACSLSPARLFVQIGGGALATAVMDGLSRGRAGLPPPRLHPVQPRSAHPYLACWARAVPVLLAERGLTDPGSDAERAALLHGTYDADELMSILTRSPSLMVPWPQPPHSVASGILDDVTYDWPTVMTHQVISGGWPVAVAEDTFVAAADLAKSRVEPPPDETGAAGLAGLLTLAASSGGLPTGQGEANVVLLTGVRR